MIVKYIVVFIGTAALAKCQSPGLGDCNEKLNPGFVYSVNHPTQVFEMPAQLKEISALSMSDDDQLLTLNDEEGKIFKINRDSGKMMSEVVFNAEGGDFEGIEMVGQTVYALKSKGKLYAVYNYTEPQKLQTESFSCPALNREADVEGLGYDAQQNVLLLACKAARTEPSEREVWSFNPQTKQFSEEAVFKLGYQNIRTWLLERNANMTLFSDFSAETSSSFQFGCSGFAVHPKTGLYYYLSSPGKLLLVCKNDGTILNIVKLDKKVHPQPEGITFGLDGTLYICNEGKKENSPKIYRIPENRK